MDLTPGPCLVESRLKNHLFLGFGGKTEGSDHFFDKGCVEKSRQPLISSHRGIRGESNGEKRVEKNSIFVEQQFFEVASQSPNFGTQISDLKVPTKF